MKSIFKTIKELNDYLKNMTDIEYKKYNLFLEKMKIIKELLQKSVIYIDFFKKVDLNILKEVEDFYYVLQNFKEENSSGK